MIERIDQAMDMKSIQEKSKNFGLFFCSFVLFLQGMSVGTGLVYAGLVLPHHVK